MGRYVTFYVTLSNYIEGNAYGFDQFVEASGTTQNDTDNSNLTRSEDVEAPEGTDPVAAPAAPAAAPHASTSQRPAPSTSAAPAAAAANPQIGTGGSQPTASGAQIYDAEGKKIQLKAHLQQMTA